MNFFATKKKNKKVYQVGALRLTISHTTLLSNLDHMCLPIDADRFRFHVHEDFEVNVGLRETLVTGKLLNGMYLTCLSPLLFGHFNTLFNC